jgi:hypothetical protein
LAASLAQDCRLGRCSKSAAIWVHRQSNQSSRHATHDPKAERREERVDPQSSPALICEIIILDGRARTCDEHEREISISLMQAGRMARADLPTPMFSHQKLMSAAEAEDILNRGREQTQAQVGRRRPPGYAKSLTE